MIQLIPVGPGEFSGKDLERLWEGRALNEGKPKEFSSMLSAIWSGEWDVYRIKGDVKGIVVLNPEPPRLNIYFLHGEQLFGKIKPLARRLMDIAREQGLMGLSLVTTCPRKARLFRMAPGVRSRRVGKWFVLELDDGR